MKSIIMKRAFRKLWDMDVTIVICAGNEGRDITLDKLTPQIFGDATNELITVGGVNKEGLYYTDTINKADGGSKGEVNLYAGAIDVTVARHDQADDSTTISTGTSLAAPAVVRFKISKQQKRICG
jgi:hypothetical protein